MLRFLVRRVLYMVPTLWVISLVVFLIIQLPPGDFVTSLIARRRAQRAGSMTQAELDALREYYGLDENVFVQYWTWMSRIVFDGNLGTSFEFNQPVAELVGDRLPMTLFISFATLLMVWAIAFPVGVYSAVRQYSIGDYAATTFGYLGLATPNFLIGLVLMVVGAALFNYVPAGICSPEWCDASWNLGKVLDLLKYLWVPMLVIGTAGTAALIRILRANLLDELRKPYVVAARARGVPERRLLVRYPLRVAMNPFVSTVGWVLPILLSGDIIVGRLLGLPTIGPMLLNALQNQDMHLAGSIILILSALTVIGTLISDLLLAWLDPRIRLGYQR